MDNDSPIASYNVFDEYLYEKKRREAVLAEKRERRVERRHSDARRNAVRTLSYTIREMNALDMHPDIWQTITHEILDSDHFTLCQVARRLGVSTRTVMRIRDGRTQKPHYRTAYRLYNMHKDIHPEYYDKST